MMIVCKSCGSQTVSSFDTEINIHFLGTKGTDRPSVFAFPMIEICMNCGHMESALSAAELRLLRNGTRGSSGSNTAVA